MDSTIVAHFLDLTRRVSDENMDTAKALSSVIDLIGSYGYTLEEVNADKPWGAYIRSTNSLAGAFIGDFFPGLTLEEAQQGIPDAQLSPKILIVAPGQQLSWQYHARRAERWRFLTDGGYYRSENDEQGEMIYAKAGDVVQFAPEERHRLCAANNQTFTFVAEIWQHTDSNNLSNEDDIVRLQDKYNRNKQGVLQHEARNS